IIIILIIISHILFSSHFFFTHPATTEIYTLSLHDALPISPRERSHRRKRNIPSRQCSGRLRHTGSSSGTFEGWRWRESRLNTRRSEEHTSELQSRSDLVCRLLLEKKKKKKDKKKNKKKKKKKKTIKKNHKTKKKK